MFQSRLGYTNLFSLLARNKQRRRRLGMCFNKPQVDPKNRTAIAPNLGRKSTYDADLGNANHHWHSRGERGRHREVNGDGLASLGLLPSFFFLLITN